MATGEEIISFNLHPSSSQDGALDILIGAGINYAATEQILGLVPEHNNKPSRNEGNSGNNKASRA